MATTGDRVTQEANVTVQKGTRVLTPPARTRPTTPAEQETGTVQVWPHLVVIEFLGALIITINMVLLSTLFNGPFLGLANPDKTPNPSKAPWYFLNLQELLLHMNPALAGVIVPTLALVLIAAIPYVDRGSKGLGVWWYSPRGPKVAMFTAIYTTAVAGALIALDKFFPLKSNFTAWLDTADVSRVGQAGFLSFLTELAGDFLGGNSPEARHANAVGVLVEAIVGWGIPILCFIIFPILLVVLLKAAFKGIDKTEIIIGLFTGFVTLYFVLTFVGTAMRGPSMDLYPPWALPPNQEG
ncbi:MAG: menaquinol-cytochrome C reductase [Chloroflexota bacterium]